MASLRVAVLAAALVGASAFLSGAPRRAPSSGLRMVGEMSQSLPFLKRPAALTGEYAGDVGFDPLGFTDIQSVHYLRQAELKHGRVAMLAVVGLMAQSLFHLPGAMHEVASPFEAVAKNPAAQAQIFSFIACIELATIEKQVNCEGEAGDLGFDPLGMTPKDAASYETMKLKELKNGRLAMFASLGILVQSILFPSKSPFDF